MATTDEPRPQADPPRSRPRRTARRRVTVRPAVPCVCHAPLPPLPRRLRAIEVAYHRRWDRTRPPSEHDELTPEHLTLDARARLLERAELRARPVAMSDRH